MKIIADKDIPLVEHFFAKAGELVLLDASSITQRNLRSGDILLARSVTQINKALLADTKIKYVASPTTGFDHFDIEWLAQAGIAWSVAPGCNAVAVTEYVLCAIAGLQKNGWLNQKTPRAGVIGAGRIGSQVAEKLQSLGFDVLVCDPYRALGESDFVSTPLEDFQELDFITLHTPLTKNGAYPTYHMIEKSFLLRQKDNCVLLNSSRGAVINFNDLKVFGEQLIWCLDVWENEPSIDFTILDTTLIATPHIAGYTVQSKSRGTAMIYQTLLQNQIISSQQIPIMNVRKTLSCATATDWREVLLQVYDPYTTTSQMKQQLIEAESSAFTRLRKQFIAETARYEFASIDLKDISIEDSDKKILEKLGFANL